MKEIRKFVNDLASRKSSTTVFNPYFRRPDLRENLFHYLTWHHKKQSNILLVGEAPGFAGCRLTGIPFSSGELLQESNHKLIQEIRPNVSLKKVESEKTAKMVWDCLEKYDSTPIFWNSFPFHPYPENQPRKNRRPNAEEIREGLGYLKKLAEIFNPKTIAAIGRAGERSLQLLDNNEVQYIRHPSYGGKADFLKGMHEVLS